VFGRWAASPSAGFARDYPKLAVGGVTRLRGDARHRFIQQVFARVWPKRVYGLAVGSKDAVLSAPWYRRRRVESGRRRRPSTPVENTSAVPASGSGERVGTAGRGSQQR